MTNTVRQALDDGPFTALELRYLRDAVRFRLEGRLPSPGTAGMRGGTRSTPPSDTSRLAIPADRRGQLDALAEWIVQEGC